MEMVGVIWVAGPQYGREPSAARAPHRLHEQCLTGDWLDAALCGRFRGHARSLFAFDRLGRGLTFGELNELVAMFMQYGDEPAEEIGQPF